MSKKNFILHLVEREGLNPVWTLLELLQQISEEQAHEFCEQHDLLRLLPTPLPTRTVDEAIADLYERRMATLFGDEDPDPYAGSEWAGGQEG